MLRVLIDTCVWLDLAKDPRGERLIATLRALTHRGEVDLMVPELVIDEYSRNRDTIVASLTTSLRAHLRTTRAMLAESDASTSLVDQFDDAATRGPLVREFVVNRFTEVAELLAQGTPLPIDDDCRQHVVARAIAKTAPFHRGRNSTADAVLAELFHQAWNRSDLPAGHTFVFLTHNTKDFSDPSDDRQPHPDLSNCFAHHAVHYSTSLEKTLLKHIPGAAELIAENDLPEEPRSGQEILRAETKIRDLLWYQLSRHTMTPTGEHGRQRVEATYAADELGPTTNTAGACSTESYRRCDGSWATSGTCSISDTTPTVQLCRSQSATEKRNAD